MELEWLPYNHFPRYFGIDYFKRYNFSDLGGRYDFDNSVIFFWALSVRHADVTGACFCRTMGKSILQGHLFCLIKEWIRSAFDCALP